MNREEAVKCIVIFTKTVDTLYLLTCIPKTIEILLRYMEKYGPELALMEDT